VPLDAGSIPAASTTADPDPRRPVAQGVVFLGALSVVTLSESLPFD